MECKAEVGKYLIKGLSEVAILKPDGKGLIAQTHKYWENAACEHARTQTISFMPNGIMKLSSGTPLFIFIQRMNLKHSLKLIKNIAVVITFNREKTIVISGKIKIKPFG